jgi:hypothetical protein
VGSGGVRYKAYRVYARGLSWGMFWPPCDAHWPSVHPSQLVAWRVGVGASERGRRWAVCWRCPHSGEHAGALPCAHRTAYALMGSNAKRSAAGVGPGVPRCGRPSGNEVPHATRPCTAHAASNELPLQSRAAPSTWLSVRVRGLAIWRSCVHSTNAPRN